MATSTIARNSLTWCSVFDVVHEYLARRFEEGQRAVSHGRMSGRTKPAGWITWMGERGMSQMAATASAEERERLSQSLARLSGTGST